MSQTRTPIILLAYANDRVNPDQYLRDLVEEIRQIRRSLEAKVVPPYRIVIRPNVTLDDILEVFDRHEGQVELFHYAGHASSLSLMLEKAGGAVAQAGIAGFTRLLASKSGLRFVFLNGCSTRSHARQLVAAGLPAVIATESVINDQAAMQFAIRFYQRLADRKSVAEAFQEAEIKVQTMMSRKDDYRSLYIEEPEIPDFPWILVGPQTHWKLWTGPRRASKSLAHLLVDRFRQVETFRDSLEHILSDSSHMPHFYAIHGVRGERHRSLVQRFQEIDIRYSSERWFGTELGVVHTYPVRDWPQTGDLALRQRNLKLALIKAYGLSGIKSADLDGQKLVQQQRLRGGTVVLQHKLDAERWDQVTPRLIRWYVSEFWRLQAQANLPQFIIFLNIIFPREKSTLLSRLLGFSTPRQRIQRQLYQFEAEFNDKFTPLRELKPIPYGDVEAWVEDFYPDMLADLPEVLYGDNQRRRLPMEVVERELKREVQRLERELAQREIYEDESTR